MAPALNCVTRLGAAGPTSDGLKCCGVLLVRWPVQPSRQAEQGRRHMQSTEGQKAQHQNTLQTHLHQGTIQRRQVQLRTWPLPQRLHVTSAASRIWRSPSLLAECLVAPHTRRGGGALRAPGGQAWSRRPTCGRAWRRPPRPGLGWPRRGWRSLGRSPSRRRSRSAAGGSGRVGRKLGATERVQVGLRALQRAHRGWGAAHCAVPGANGPVV